MKDKIIIITAEKKMEQKLEPLIRELGDRAVVTFLQAKKQLNIFPLRLAK